MRISKHFNKLKAPRTTILMGAAICIFYAGYFAYLQKKETDADARYADLQANDDAAYLDNVGEMKGFDAYFAEYSRMRDYETPQETVPPFLLGRWATFDAAKQVRENYVPELCSDGVIIEDGKVKVFGEAPRQFDVAYMIDGDDVVATSAGGSKVVITPVAYTRHIHHLMINLPGEGAPRFAYLCK